MMSLKEKVVLTGTTAVGLGVLLAAGYAKTHNIQPSKKGSKPSKTLNDCMQELIANNAIEISRPYCPTSSNDFCLLVAHAYTENKKSIADIANKLGQMVLSGIVLKLGNACIDLYKSIKNPPTSSSSCCSSN